MNPRSLSSRYWSWPVIVLVALLYSSAWAEEFQYVYDASGQLIKAIDSSGTMIEYVYDDAGNIQEIRRTTVSPFEIFGFQPTRTTPGAVVTIQGQGFSPTPAGNQVEIGGQPATVVGVEGETLLSVIVPTGSTTAPISITVNGTTALSVDSLEIIGAPQIGAISPPGGLAGQIVSELRVAGTDLLDSTFHFEPAADSPSALGSPSIDFSGDSAVFPVSIDPASTGEYALVATNPAGSSSATPGPGNTFKILNPTEDEDGDGLSNEDERSRGTDAFKTDTDDDGFSDGVEVTKSTNPLDPDDVPTLNGSIDYGDSVVGTISPVSEVEIYEFTGSVDDEIEIPWFATAAFGFRLLVELYSPSGQHIANSVIEINTSGGFGTGSLRTVLPESGSYLVIVRTPNQSATTAGNFNFTLQRTVDPGNLIDVLAIGETRSGSISPVTQIDVYRFSAQAGDQIEVPWFATAGL